MVGGVALLDWLRWCKSVGGGRGIGCEVWGQQLLAVLAGKHGHSGAGDMLAVSMKAWQLHELLLLGIVMRRHGPTNLEPLGLVCL